MSEPAGIEAVPPSPADGGVTVAYVHDVGVSHSWHMSMIELVGHDLGAEGRILRGGWIAVRCGTDSLAEARNKAVAEFLDERDAEWLFWVDTDMGFLPDVVDQLVAAADRDARPIVGALCFAWKETGTDAMGGYRCSPRPTIYDWKTKYGETGFLGRTTYPPNALVQCSATGSAAILIHRDVLAAMRASFGDQWYDRIPNPSTGGNLIGEDLSFCMRAGAMGVPVFVHTGVPTTHHKDVWVGEVDYMTYSAGSEMLAAVAADEELQATQLTPADLLRPAPLTADHVCPDDCEGLTGQAWHDAHSFTPAGGGQE